MPTNPLTEQDVRTAVQTTATDIINEFRKTPDTPRETLMDRVFEECDLLFGQLVEHQRRVAHYTLADLLRTVQPAAMILQVAAADAYVEDDTGLWEGISPYGLVASMAFFSLEHLLYAALERAGYDINADYPFDKEPSVPPDDPAS